MHRKKITEGGPSTRPYYDSPEFRSRWHSDETIESIALDLDVTINAVWNAAQRRGYPNKRNARPGRERSQ